VEYLKILDRRLRRSEKSHENVTLNLKPTTDFVERDVTDNCCMLFCRNLRLESISLRKVC